MRTLRKSFFILSLWCVSALGLHADDFAVVAYNVENLFDVDAVAIYDDYSPKVKDPTLRYGREKLLTKLTSIAKVLSTVNDGKGPEIILFQELENDFTPSNRLVDADRFLATHRGETVQDMLREGWKSEYADLSSELWLLKALSDAGLGAYHSVTAPYKSEDAKIAHTNAVFSQFPIKSVMAHPLTAARDILEVELDVDGVSLWVYANHWKSGASSPKREPIRVQNATVLRALVEARKAKDPDADIIIGGDLNSHYNHSILYPNMETGINDVLLAQGDEAAQTVEGDTLRLYNLWYELAPEQRYSEVWRGNRGSLMHLILADTLYDWKGISYVDGSFHQLMVPDVNADAIGRPISWNAVGLTGGGASDHFPVMARFTVGAFRSTGPFSDGKDALDYEMPLTVATELSGSLPDGLFLNQVTDPELGSYIDHLYQIDAEIVSKNPFKIQVGGVEWDAYVPEKALYGKLVSGPENQQVQLVVTPGWWKGSRQFVVEGILPYE